jgi:hypothetical protein
MMSMASAVEGDEVLERAGGSKSERPLGLGTMDELQDDCPSRSPVNVYEIGKGVVSPKEVSVPRLGVAKPHGGHQNAVVKVTVNSLARA